MEIKTIPFLHAENLIALNKVLYMLHKNDKLDTIINRCLEESMSRKIIEVNPRCSRQMDIQTPGSLIRESKGERNMSDKIIFSPGSFFHGTKADLNIGDFLVTGMRKNYSDTRKSRYIYFSGTLDAAIWGAELAEGDGRERIYIVEPTGDFEDDPNLTDKKFPGNPTKSYRTKHPLKIIAEVTKWEGHPSEVINRMLENLRELSEKGIKAMD